jgi:hypothetical protein
LHSSAPKNSVWLTTFIRSMPANTPPNAPKALGLLPKRNPYRRAERLHCAYIAAQRDEVDAMLKRITAILGH